MRVLAVFAMLAGAASVRSQNLPLEPLHETGASITGAFEGWFKNPDGTFSLLLGYYNRNLKQELDIPIGPDNRIEPGGPDRGQPTHFLASRQWGMFRIVVPADFGDNKLTWTIVANGQTTVIPAGLKTDYEISPFAETAAGNTPPVISFSEHGATIQGPLSTVTERTAKAGMPLALPLWISDDARFTSSSGTHPRSGAPPVTLKWSLYRGPAEVTFANDRPKVEGKLTDAGFTGTASTTATFGQPGQYILHVVANDYSGEGGGGFQCCWTTARVAVTVEP
jgi:hypothetical protein